MLPANAKLDYSGHSWECERGYRKSGAQCAAVAVPENAKLDYSGQDWECNEGFVQRNKGCISVASATDAELIKLLIAQSISSYPGSCPCPYFADRAGRSCGGRSAYSRAGGYSPLCYEQDVSVYQIAELRRRYKN